MTSATETITERGIVYAPSATNTSLEIDNAGVEKVVIGDGLGAFSTPISNLTNATEYIFRAYATSASGTSYTSPVSFSTLMLLTPITQENIQTAVEAWVADATAAEATYGHMKDWDVTNVHTVSELFSDKAQFNEDISAWNVSNITNMSFMFSGAASFNQDITSWAVSGVTNMNGLFLGATNFNQDIGDWIVSNVSNMSEMFQEASTFNQDISTWKVSKITDMNRMFLGATSFNQDIGDWDVSNARTMDQMFQNANNFNQNLSNWCVSNIASEPENFSFNSALETSNHPLWGTCPASTPSDIIVTQYINIFLVNNNEIGISGITIGNQISVDIFSLLFGKKVGSYTIERAEVNNYIQLNNLRRGLYVVKLKTGTTIKTKKIIIE